MSEAVAKLAQNRSSLVIANANNITVFICYEMGTNLNYAITTYSSYNTVKIEYPVPKVKPHKSSYIIFILFHNFM